MGARRERTSQWVPGPKTDMRLYLFDALAEAALFVAWAMAPDNSAESAVADDQ